MHFGGSCPLTEFCQLQKCLPPTKFTLRPSLAFSYIGSVTARHSSSGRQPNFVAWYWEWNYGTFAEDATVFGWAAVTFGIGPHYSLVLNFFTRQVRGDANNLIVFVASSKNYTKTRARLVE